MIVLPFLFFSALTAYWWYRHGRLDVCVYMGGLYALTSLLAIVIVQMGMMGEGGILYDNDTAEFNIVPTLLFCGCIGLCLLPFSMIYGRDIQQITIRSPWAVDLLSLMLIAVSFLNLYLVADSTMDILQGDLAQIRNDAYAGVESPAQLKAETMPFALKFFYYFHFSTILCIPIFFYNLCFRHKPWWFQALLAFASLSCPIAGIQVADRTEIVYYGEMVIFCFLFFYRFIPTRTKWRLLVLSLPVIVAGVTYLVAVSQARFDTKESSGSDVRAIQYAGQGYINFCYFYENGKFDYIASQREFPLINHFFFHEDSNADLREQRTGEQGFFMSVFATFIGDVMLDITPIGMIVWVISFFMLTMLVIRSSHRDTWDLSEVLLLYLLAVVPIFGIFYYRFFFFTYTFIFILVLILLFLSFHKFSLK